jgi:LemA protein
MLGTLIFVVVVVAIAVLLVGIYNALVRLRNQVRNAWSQIDVQLKRRHDLIPNLVETVKGYAGHEKQTLENVIKARSQAVSAQGVEAQSVAEGALSSALGRLMVVVEQYPDLKANQNFLALQEELTSTENKISFSRQHYNDSAMVMNNKVEAFPSNVVAGMFGFNKEPFFEIQDEAARETPKVQF